MNRGVKGEKKKSDGEVGVGVSGSGVTFSLR